MVEGACSFFIERSEGMGTENKFEQYGLPDASSGTPMPKVKDHVIPCAIRTPDDYTEVDCTGLLKRWETKQTDKTLQRHKLEEIDCMEGLVDNAIWEIKGEIGRDNINGKLKVLYRLYSQLIGEEHSTQC